MKGQMVRAVSPFGKRLAFLVAVALLLGVTAGGARAGFLDDLAKRMAKAVGGAFTDKTDDLSAAMVEVRFIRNLYPKGMTNGTEEDILLGDLWKDGQHLVTLRCWQQGAVKLYEIEGTVKVDGEVVPYAGSGMYAKVVSDLKPHTFTVETKKGLKYEFTAKPGAEIRIESPRESEVDASQPLEVRLSNPPGSENSMVRLALQSRPSVTQKSWATLVGAKSADQFTVPAICFRRRPAQGNLLDGSSHLLAERWQVEIQPGEGVASVRTVSIAWDVAPVKVKGTKAANDTSVRGKDGEWITSQGIFLSREAAKDRMPYYLMVSDAYYTQPLSRLRKVAIVSFNVRATKLTQVETKEWTTVDKQVYGTMLTGATVVTTTTKHQGTFKQKFPEFPKEWWDAMTEGLYKDTVEVLQGAGVEVVPIEQVLKSPSYALLRDMPDEITETEYTSTYGGLRNIYGGSGRAAVGGAFAGLSQQQFLKEIGADGIMTVTVDLAMPWGELSLRPRVQLNITGLPNGPQVMGTCFAAGQIQGDGTDVRKLQVSKDTYAPDVLEKCIRRDAIREAFSEALRRLKEAEDKAGYAETWSLQ